MSIQPVDVLAVMHDLREIVDDVSEGRPEEDRLLAEANAAIAVVAELIEKADAVQASMLPTLVRQSTKNANAGFIDWRDWVALYGEVNALRQALARVQGNA